MHYNFARFHQAHEAIGCTTTPEMAAGKAGHVRSVWEIAGWPD
jgi:hypothetical protein